MALTVEPLATDAERTWCARLMASSDPWITLKRGFADCYNLLGNTAKQRYLVSAGETRAGVLILDLLGPFPGYIQSICLAPEARGRGLGSQVIQWAEARIFRESPNVFICVSSFNRAAQRLYTRLGYQIVGSLTDFVLDGHDELLLRKSRGSWEWFRREAGSAERVNRA